VFTNSLAMCCTVWSTLACRRSMSQLKMWRGWGHCLVYRVATVYDVVLQRLHVHQCLWWMTLAMLCSGVFYVWAQLEILQQQLQGTVYRDIYIRYKLAFSSWRKFKKKSIIWDRNL